MKLLLKFSTKIHSHYFYLQISFLIYLLFFDIATLYLHIDFNIILEKKLKNMTLNCNGKIINFNTQKIMGILNISDDSFYDGGRYNSLDKAISRVSEMINQGLI